MSDISNYARDAKMMGGGYWAKPTNPSKSNTGLNRQYFTDATRANAELRGQLADNCYDALCQGLNAGDWYGWTAIQIRTDFASRSSTGDMLPDDWQRIHIIQPARYTYIPTGAYITYAGNTWIVYKGYNMGVGLGQAILRRCNQVINTLDWYGNIVTVPLSYAKMATLGNSSHASENSIISKNYMDCICQLNEISAAFAENTRIILNRTAYAMRGVDNFTREYTEDAPSGHIITFTIERVEPTSADDLTLSCADYNSFSWEIDINGNGAMRTGAYQSLGVTSKRNGVLATGSTEHPIDYTFYSSDDSILTVDGTGTVYAAATGTATITVALSQNPGIQQTFEITVGVSGGAYVAFTSTPPAALREMESCTVSAGAFNASENTGTAVTLTGSGASAYAYAIESAGTNTWTVTCYAASPAPLTLRAESGGESAAVSIKLTS